MVNTQTTNPAVFSESFSRALRNKDEAEIQAHMEQLARMKEAERNEILNTPDNTGCMPVHVAVSMNNKQVTETLYGYHQGDLPQTHVMGEDEYIRYAGEDGCLYDYYGNATPDGTFTRPGGRASDYIYNNRRYNSEDYPRPDVEVAVEGRNPLYVAASEIGFDGKRNETTSFVIGQSTEKDYQAALGQALGRSDHAAIENLLKIGKERGWAPSQENIEEVDDLKPYLGTEELVRIDETTNRHNKSKAKLKRDLTKIHVARRDKLYKDLVAAAKGKNPEAARRAAKACYDFMGDEALFHFSKENNPKAMQYLIEAGADINAYNSDGKTPLMVAAENNKRDSLRFLANHDECDLNAQDANGDTAMHWLVKNKYYKHVKILQEAGARVDVPNTDGETALSLAQQGAKNGDRSILNVVEQGARAEDTPTQAPTPTPTTVPTPAPIPTPAPSVSARIGMNAEVVPAGDAQQTGNQKER